jgi:hypothetical protein
MLEADMAFPRYPAFGDELASVLAVSMVPVKPERLPLRLRLHCTKRFHLPAFCAYPRDQA